LRQPQAFARQLIDAGRRRAARFAAAVWAEVAVADVVGEDEDDVRLLVLRHCRRGGEDRPHEERATERKQALLSFHRGPSSFGSSVVDCANSATSGLRAHPWRWRVKPT
jgi:hypothetical protein